MLSSRVTPPKNVVLRSVSMRFKVNEESVDSCTRYRFIPATACQVRSGEKNTFWSIEFCGGVNSDGGGGGALGPVATMNAVWTLLSDTTAIVSVLMSIVTRPPLEYFKTTGPEYLPVRLCHAIVIGYPEGP